MDVTRQIMRRIVTGLVEAQERFRIYDGWLLPDGEFVGVDAHGLTAAKLLAPDVYAEAQGIEDFWDEGEDWLARGEITQEQFDSMSTEYEAVDHWEWVDEVGYGEAWNSGWIRISGNTITIRDADDEDVHVLRNYLWDSYPYLANSDDDVTMDVDDISGRIPAKLLYDKSVTAEDLKRALQSKDALVALLMEPSTKTFRPRVVPRRRAKGKPRTAQQSQRIGDSL
jgi:hypothetical protein